MNQRTDIAWLEELLEGHYGFAPTGELRERLSSVWHHRTALECGGNPQTGRLRQVAESLVVGETYFFRERAQIDYLVRKRLDDRALDAAVPKPYRILSAGCASGEEAYSLAIAMDTLGPTFLRGVSITGVDVSAAAIRKAKAASYSAWSLRSTPENLRDKWFHRRGDEYQLDERFRERVRFEERNLFEVDGEFWAPGAFDVIFCRNVAIYFSMRALQDLAARFAYVLEPGGWLFLGHSETLRGISDDFDLVHDGDVFYYRRKKDSSSRIPATSPSPIDVSMAAQAPTDMLRLEELDAPMHRGINSRVSRRVTIGEKPQNTAIRRQIVNLIETERFDDAWTMLGQLPMDAQGNLLLAVIQTAKGLFEDAERVCHALISSGHNEADAHCLLGSCREHQRAFDSAARHYREAARLDGRFAIPHLRLGLLLDRSGDAIGALVELEQAMERIENEDPERIALFGGGFSRKMLRELCKERIATRVI